jgi:XRE family aerobic/anaerobic benzoate catabolism transcriptional regulator
MANDSAAMAELIAILANREALYARADVVLDTAGKPVERSLAELSELLRRVGTGPLPEPPDRDPRR